MDSNIDKDEIVHQRKVVWIRGTFLALAAIYISVAISSVAIQNNAIDECVRSSTRADAGAKNWQSASDVRRKAGDVKVATTYITNAQVIRNSIPMPDGWKASAVPGRGDINDRGRDAGDRRTGCEDSHKALFPFM